MTSVEAWPLTPVTPTYHRIHLNRPTVWTGLPVSRHVGGVSSSLAEDKRPSGYARRLFRLLWLFLRLPWFCARAGVLAAATLPLR